MKALRGRASDDGHSRGRGCGTDGGDENRGRGRDDGRALREL